MGGGAFDRIGGDDRNDLPLQQGAVGRKGDGAAVAVIGISAGQPPAYTALDGKALQIDRCHVNGRVKGGANHCF